MEAKETFACVSCFLTLLLCFFTLGQFVLFLSSHTYLKYPYTKYNSNFEKNGLHEGTFIPLMQNIALVCIFIAQHSLQAKRSFKKFLHTNGLGVLERLLYNCGSCFALQFVMYFWKPLLHKTVWEVSTGDHTVLWCVFTIVHFISWLTIYSGCSVMDLSELLGAKQVYYYVLNWPDPLIQKSESLKRFYSHMRHPGFAALVVILFIHPVMQLDRLILAHVMTVYMILGFRVDEIDYEYQRRLLQRKFRDLNVSS